MNGEEEAVCICFTIIILFLATCFFGYHYFTAPESRMRDFTVVCINPKEGAPNIRHTFPLDLVDKIHIYDNSIFPYASKYNENPGKLPAVILCPLGVKI